VPLQKCQWPFWSAVKSVRSSMNIWIYIRRVCSAAGIILCLATSFAGQPASATEPKREPKRVLLLHPSSGANLLYATNIRAELDRQSPEPLEVYDSSFMVGRPDDEFVADRYGDYLRALFADHRVDLVVAVGGASVRLFHRYRLQLFPTTPILAIAEGRRLPVSDPSANETTIATSIDFAEVVENILRVLPETTNVAVVIGTSSIEQYWLEQMRVAFQPFASRVSFTWLNDLSFEDLLNRAARLPPRSAIFFVLMLADIAGVAHEENTVFSMISAVANAPIFSTTMPTSAMGLSAARSSPCKTKAKRRLAWLSGSLAARLRARSQHHPSDFQRRSSIGGNCSAGASVRPVCRPEAISTFALRPRGSDIACKFCRYVRRF
jgi:hypothetical protein